MTGSTITASVDQAGVLGSDLHRFGILEQSHVDRGAAELDGRLSLVESDIEGAFDSGEVFGQAGVSQGDGILVGGVGLEADGIEGDDAAESVEQLAAVAVQLGDPRHSLLFAVENLGERRAFGGLESHRSVLSRSEELVEVTPYKRVSYLVTSQVR